MNAPTPFIVLRTEWRDGREEVAGGCWTLAKAEAIASQVAGDGYYARVVARADMPASSWTHADFSKVPTIAQFEPE